MNDRRLMREAADLWRAFAVEEKAFFAKHHRRPKTAALDAREDAHRIDEAVRQDEPLGPLDPLYLELTRRR